MISRLPLVGDVAVEIYRRYRGVRFPGSKRHWERHYASGGSSGCGSRGRLAVFKADTMSRIVSEHRVESVIEFGCGDGGQLALIDYPRYVGLDVSSDAISQCIERFSDDDSKSFLRYDDEAFSDRAGFLKADLGVSLDVLYHLVERTVYERYLAALFGAARRVVVVYSSNTDENYRTSPHVRHRQFVRDVQRLCQDWKLSKKIENPYPEESFADFFVFVRT